MGFVVWSALIVVALVGPAAAAAAPAAREPFGRAHVQLMARAQKAKRPATMADVYLWAEGARLRAVVVGDPEGAQFWIDGLALDPVRLVKGQVQPARTRTLARGVELALIASTDSANHQNDRVAGKPCKVVVDQLKGGYTMRRCMWRGLPLSVELNGPGFDFNAAATLVEERVSLADLQPPQGAAGSPRVLNAAR